jgi:glutathione S-transferase
MPQYGAFIPADRGDGPPSRIRAREVRVHRIPFSTNVERVALACAFKGLEVEWVDHDPGDRSAIRALSGQDLVPVAETPDGVVADSRAILRRLEDMRPDPPLWPRAARDRAAADTFLEWFDEVWKRPPNALAAGDDDPRHAERLAGWLRRFEDRLTGADFLLADEVTVADFAVFPFLKYPVLGLEPGDEDPFHRVLVGTMAEPGPNVRRWVWRIDSFPRG